MQINVLDDFSKEITWKIVNFAYNREKNCYAAFKQHTTILAQYFCKKFEPELG